MSIVTRSGMFAVYKPPGITSADVTNRLKSILSTESQQMSKGRLIDKIKVGHGGTLDMFAEGVLVIGVGKDCKKLGHFQKNVIKRYSVMGQLGVTTDSLDPNGMETERKEWTHVSEEAVRNTLKNFHGKTTQTAPVFSAIKYRGKRLSDYARNFSEVSVNPPQKQVHINSVSLVHFTPPNFLIDVTCSSGTYMRSLVRDIAGQLNTVGYVIRLCRTMQGPFTLDHAIQADEDSLWSTESILSAIERCKTLVQSKC